jgi:hypothetical protein
LQINASSAHQKQSMQAHKSACDPACHMGWKGPVPVFLFFCLGGQMFSSTLMAEPQPSGAQLQFPPLGQVTKPFLTTEEAAFYLSRRPQTLRIWACRECGPIRPIRVNGRLGWLVKDLLRLMGQERLN